MKPLQQNNTIPKGYKTTEIGVIPEEWEVITYNEAFDFLSTATYSRAELSVEGDIKYIHYGDIHTRFEHLLNLKVNLPKISLEKSKRYSLIKEGDIIMADASEDYEGVGKSVEVLNHDNLKAISGLHTFLLRGNDNFVNGYKAYISENPLVKNSFQRLATGMKVYGVSKTNLKNILIPKPPKKEQQAIAQVLSNTDRCIESIAQLIAKKKAIKQGAMQELLTGKKRLTGFDGEWETKKLGEVVDFLKGNGLSKSKINYNGTKSCILYGELFTTYKEVIKKVVSKTSFDEGVSSKTGDILMPGSTTTNGIDLANASCLNVEKVLLGGDINILRPKINVNSEFLSRYLTNIKKTEIAQETQGITIIHLYGKKLHNIQIDFPNYQEQQAIAQILSDMDAEIEALTAQLHKTKALKQGLMQELLTGKTRLVKPKTYNEQDLKLNTAAEP